MPISSATFTITEQLDSPSIGGTVVRYQVSEFGGEPPDGLWYLEIPEIPPGFYLWTYTNVLYTDGTQNESYSVSKVGEKGDTGQSPVHIQTENLQTFIRCDALGQVLSYENSGAKFWVKEGTKELTPVQTGTTLENGQFSIEILSSEGVLVGEPELDETAGAVFFGSVSRLAQEKASVEYAITCKTFDGLEVCTRSTQTVQKLKEGFGGRTWIRFSSEDCQLDENGVLVSGSLEEMTNSPGIDTRFIGVVITDTVFAPEEKSAYKWQPFRFSEQQTGNEIPKHPYTGLIWATGQNPQSSGSTDPATFQANTQYRCIGVENGISSWELYTLNTVNLVGEHVFAENGVFKGFQSANWDPVAQTGTRLDLQKGELLLYGTSLSNLLSYDTTTGVMTLGERDSGTSLELVAGKLSIRQGGTELAYFEREQLYITNAQITKQMKIGNYVQEEHSSGQLFDTWLGGGFNGSS